MSADLLATFQEPAECLGHGLIIWCFRGKVIISEVVSEREKNVKGQITPTNHLEAQASMVSDFREHILGINPSRAFVERITGLDSLVFTDSSHLSDRRPRGQAGFQIMRIM